MEEKQGLEDMGQRGNCPKYKFRMKRGAKVIDLDMSGSMTTWIRDESGDKKIQQLNEMKENHLVRDDKETTQMRCAKP